VSIIIAWRHLNLCRYCCVTSFEFVSILLCDVIWICVDIIVWRHLNLCRYHCIASFESIFLYDVIWIYVDIIVWRHLNRYFRMTSFDVMSIFVCDIIWMYVDIIVWRRLNLCRYSCWRFKRPLYIHKPTLNAAYDTMILWRPTIS